MNEQTSKLIEQLAQKLGTTTEYLWSILLKQAYIQSLVTLIQFILISIFGYILLKIHKKLICKKNYDGKIITGYNHYAESAVIPMVIAVGIFGLLAVNSLFWIEDVINGLFNPEYWALSKILNSIK